MIKSVNNYPVSTLLKVEADVVYAIPRYQREYKWGKGSWDNLFDDLLENEFNYFLGSIICINQSNDAIGTQQLELVDGQQRMTTLSILLAAVYSIFSNDAYLDGLDDDDTQDVINDRLNLKYKLVLKNQKTCPRLIPQVQNDNQQDYFAVLKMAGILKDADIIPNAGNRRVFKAYRHFCARIDELQAKKTNKLASLKALIDKINTATLVKIEVVNHSDAYTLFESLNNRGVPLTAVDLIKNKLLAKLEQQHPGEIDEHFKQWQKVIKALGDDYALQERYFRQYYNGFKPDLKKIVSVPVATKSNLMQVYEKLINDNPTVFLKNTIKGAELYQQITARVEIESQPKLSRLLLQLDRVQAAPSYVLLLNMFSHMEHLDLDYDDLEKVIDFLIRFFVRRNTTDIPSTRDLTPLFMSLVEKLKGFKGAKVYLLLEKALLDVSADTETFKKHLSGNIYDDNTAVCRFVLCALEESKMTRETVRDLWLMKGSQFTWTIEHIFPQGKNIPQSWVDMIGNGDVMKADQYRETHVHQLGNLTISGYNSALGNKSFSDKRDRVDTKGRAVGYNNGLYLNEKLAKADNWSVDAIEKRTAELVNQVISMFDFPAPEPEVK